MNCVSEIWGSHGGKMSIVVLWVVHRVLGGGSNMNVSAELNDSFTLGHNRQELSS